MIERFDTALMERYLTELGWQYFSDGEQGFLVLLAADSADLHLHFRVEGPGCDVFVVRATTAASYPTCTGRSLQALAEEWNRDHYWPKAYLGDDESRVRMFGEVAYPLGVGLQWELFLELAGTAVSGMFALFDEVAAVAGRVIETELRQEIHPV